MGVFGEANCSKIDLLVRGVHNFCSRAGYIPIVSLFSIYLFIMGKSCSEQNQVRRVFGNPREQPDRIGLRPLRKK